MPQTEQLDTWGIVEVMGHRRFAGHIKEQSLAGAALIRVDVPQVTLPNGTTKNEFSKLIGVGSIYCITPTTEEAARKAARELAKVESDPLPVYIPEERQLTAAASGAPAERAEVVIYDDDEDEDEYDDFEERTR